MNPSKYELEHAIRYASEHMQLFMAEEYRKRHPHIQMEMKTRPAHKRDYYVPPTLAPKCIVVEKLSFTEQGCMALSCFPHQSDGRPCEKTDPVQWIAIGGNASSLSCQPVCWETKQQLDTQWIRNRCMAVNPLKKLLAIFPEKAFGLTSKHDLHAGLDWKNGHVYLNASYCKAYGMQFDGKDCFAPTGQTILEFLLGKTVVRAIKTSGVQPSQTTFPSVPTSLQRPVSEFPKVTDLTNESLEPSKVAQEIAAEIAFDIGVDLTTHMVEKILRKKAPKLIMKAAHSIPVKSALTQAVLHEAVSLSARSVATLGKAVSAASVVLAIYSVFALVLDVVDPFHYDYVLTSDMLKKINQRLDFMYFRREDEHVREITPDMVWYESEDQSDYYEGMAEKIEEYLRALRVDEVEHAPPKKWFNFQLQEKQDRWNWSIQLVMVVMVGTLALLWIDLIHVWGVLLFFLMVFANQNG